MANTLNTLVMVGEADKASVVKWDTNDRNSLLGRPWVAVPDPQNDMRDRSFPTWREAYDWLVSELDRD